MLLLALAPALATAAIFDRTFTHDYSGWQNAYVHTDIETSPSLALPGGKTVYCVGDTFSPTIGMQSDWYSSIYDAQLANTNNFGGCLNATCTTHSNNGMNWVNNSQYQALSSQVYYTTVSAFMSMISANNIPNNMPGECSKYLTSSYQPYNVGGNTLFKSDVGAYCKGTLNLASSNSAYSRTVAQEYTGSVPAINPPIVLNTASPSVTFTTSMSTTGCIASGRTYATAGCYEGVWLYYGAAIGYPLSAQSTPVTITVKNPFTCSAVQVTSPSLTPTTNIQPNQQMSFSFVMTNPTSNGESAKLTNVSASWSYSQPAVSGGLPKTITNNGVPVTITGTLNAPPTPGTYNFNLIVNYSSSGADCSGSVKNCTASFPFTITVASQNNPVSCTLAFESHTPVFTPIDSAWVNATCRASNNAVVPCGALSWTTTAASASMSPVSTITPPSLSRSQLTINGVSAPQLNANVMAQQGSNFSCTILLNVTAPDYIPLLSAPASAQVNTQFTAAITTKNIGAAANISTYTKLQFRSLTQPFSVPPLGQQGTQNNSYNFTCPATPGLYELNATVDYTGLLTEGNENNNFATQLVNCTAAPPAIMPDYTSHINAPATATVGATFSVGVVTTNIGNGAANASSTTRLKISNQATPYNFAVRPLAANGDSVTNTTTATCPGTPGQIQINSSADFFNQVNESSELNNNDTAIVNCVLPGNMPNYIPNITAPSVFFVGVGFIANFTTKNIGTAPGTVPSVTHVTFQSTVKDFTVVPLAVQQQQMDWWDFSCTGPGVKNMVQTVDYTGVINESDENNTETKPISCNTVPTSCNLTFIGHNSTFYQYEWAPVQATCFAGGAQTACPPFLWQQNAVGGSMNPINTNAAWTPNSTLFMTGSVTTQLGRKVNATSTLGAVPLYCELPFNVSDGSPIGPDYIVQSIIPDHPSAALGQVVQFTVTVFNQGNVNATNDSTSAAVYSPGCEIITGRDSYFLPHIDAQDSDTSVEELACTCRAVGTQNITVTANPSHAQWETNFGNNDLTQTFICQAPFQTITCSYFV